MGILSFSDSTGTVSYLLNDELSAMNFCILYENSFDFFSHYHSASQLPSLPAYRPFLRLCLQYNARIHDRYPILMHDHRIEVHLLDGGVSDNEFRTQHQ